jgi:hypothetical protein
VGCMAPNQPAAVGGDVQESADRTRFGSLTPCGEGACSRWVAQRPQTLRPQSFRHTAYAGFATAAQPSGTVRRSDKLPRHSRSRLFNGCQRYLMKATTPCVVAYAYARIRRLVRLGAGFYRWPVAEKQRSGLVARLAKCTTSFAMILRRYFYGGHAQGALGRAGLLASRSTNLCMAATFVW